MAGLHVHQLPRYPKTEEAQGIAALMRWSGKSICGVCGKRITNPRKNDKGNTGMWLCKKCKPPLKPLDRCEECQWKGYCKERVRQGLWLLCERPITDDIYRMQMMAIDEKDYRP